MSNERPLITPDISVDLVVFKIVRRVWRVISLIFNWVMFYVAKEESVRAAYVPLLHRH